MDALLNKAAELIKNSKYCIAFTGAGISVESGIPPFRGKDSIWNRYDSKILDLDTFLYTPDQSWPVIKEIFYDFFGRAKPNDAHRALAKLESVGLLKCIITQNIDNLHFEAGSKTVYEFHGNSQRLVCTKCNNHVAVSTVTITNEPLRCEICEGLMKPDFVFFGEGIPEQAYDSSMDAVRKCDVCLIIGSTGEVMPAALLPYEAKRNGAVIIEINPEESKFTSQITDIHLKGSAVELLNGIISLMK